MPKLLAAPLFFLLLTLLSCQSPVPDTTIHPLRLLPGQDLKQAIQTYVDEQNIEAGYLVTCVGSLTDWQLRMANQEGATGGSGHFEIVSLVGTVSTNGSHLHLSVADSLGRVTGGHLLEGNIIYTTAELVIGESHRHVFRREVDGSTPWPELRVTEK